MNLEINFNERISKIEELEAQAIENLNDDEIIYVLCVTNLAKHSLTYWHSEKGSLCLQVINEMPNSNEEAAGEIDWREIAVADVAAFIATCPVGVKVGVLVGGLAAGIASGGIAAGVGAVLGGIAGGTASGLAGAVSASAIVLAAETVVSWFW